MRRIRRTAAAVASLILVASCSIGAEDSPRSWSDWDRFEELPQSSTDGVERIYLVEDAPDGGTTLTTTRRDIAEGVNPFSGILDVLFNGPTSTEAREGLSSRIPSGLSVIGTPRLEQDIVVVDLSRELTNVLGDDLITALAQIVWTVGERPRVRQVRIFVEGEELSWPTADGTLVSRPLTPFDFPGFVTTSQPLFPGIIAP